MNRTIQILITVTILVVSNAALSAQGPYRNGPERGPTMRSGPAARGGQLGLISALPYEELSENEVAALNHMWEEEKLARDVYLALYEQWEIPAFWNIASSEQRHMDAVAALLEKYGLSKGDELGAGEFNDPEMTALFNQLNTNGIESEEAAFEVGATVEDMDIADLRNWLTSVDNRDIQIVFGNLLRASMNHLRAFNQLMSTEYQAQYLTQEEVEEIINMPRERGRYGIRDGSCGQCPYVNEPGSGQCRRRGGRGN